MVYTVLHVWVGHIWYVQHRGMGEEMERIEGEGPCCEKLVSTTGGLHLDCRDGFNKHGLVLLSRGCESMLEGSTFSSFELSCSLQILS